MSIDYSFVMGMITASLTLCVYNSWKKLRKEPTIKELLNEYRAHKNSEGSQTIICPSKYYKQLSEFAISFYKKIIVDEYYIDPDKLL